MAFGWNWFGRGNGNNGNIHPADVRGTPSEPSAEDKVPGGVPFEPYVRLFLRFLRFGLLAWGGPVAQISMIRQELVEEERWVSNERFNRVLGIYQALPGPEAHELCVYFGMLSRGRWGALLAGLGFMLPGFLLMLLLSWFYVSYGIESAVFAGLFYGLKPAVAALLARAVVRIGRRALSNRFLWSVAIGVGVASLLGIEAVLLLALGGLVYLLLQRRILRARRRRWSVAAGTIAMAFLAAWAVFMALANGQEFSVETEEPAGPPPPLATLFAIGLKAGLLTFGGAYTVFAFLQRDAVGPDGWMTTAQFLDGLARGACCQPRPSSWAPSWVTWEVDRLNPPS